MYIVVVSFSLGTYSPAFLSRLKIESNLYQIAFKNGICYLGNLEIVLYVFYQLPQVNWSEYPSFWRRDPASR
jgi:hypothetical protein